MKPILVLNHRQVSNTKALLQTLQEVAPENPLYLYCNGPIQKKESETLQVQKFLENLKDEREKKGLETFLFLEETFQGHLEGPIRALKWFFSQNSKGHVFEDHTIPNSHWINLHSHLLNLYENTNILCIGSGKNIRSQNQYAESLTTNFYAWSSWQSEILSLIKPIKESEVQKSENPHINKKIAWCKKNLNKKTPQSLSAFLTLQQIQKKAYSLTPTIALEQTPSNNPPPHTPQNFQSWENLDPNPSKDPFLQTQLLKTPNISLQILSQTLQKIKQTLEKTQEHKYPKSENPFPVAPQNPLQQINPKQESSEENKLCENPKEEQKPSERHKTSSHPSAPPQYQTPTFHSSHILTKIREPLKLLTKRLSGNNRRTVRALSKSNPLVKWDTDFLTGPKRWLPYSTPLLKLLLLGATIGTLAACIPPYLSLQKITKDKEQSLLSLKKTWEYLSAYKTDHGRFPPPKTWYSSRKSYTKENLNDPTYQQLTQIAQKDHPGWGMNTRFPTHFLSNPPQKTLLIGPSFSPLLTPSLDGILPPQPLSEKNPTETYHSLRLGSQPNKPGKSALYLSAEGTIWNFSPQQAKLYLQTDQSLDLTQLPTWATESAGYTRSLKYAPTPTQRIAKSESSPEGEKISTGLYKTKAIKLETLQKPLKLKILSQETQNTHLRVLFLNTYQEEINTTQESLTKTIGVYGGGTDLFVTPPKTSTLPRYITINPQEGHGHKKIRTRIVKKTPDGITLRIDPMNLHLAPNTPISTWKNTQISIPLSLPKNQSQELLLNIPKNQIPKNSQFIQLELENKTATPLLLNILRRSS